MLTDFAVSWRTGVVVGAKFLDDRVFSNAYYARVGGVSTDELNKMEREFIQLLDHRMSVSIPTLEAYCGGMERSMAKQIPATATSSERSTNVGPHGVENKLGDVNDADMSATA